MESELIGATCGRMAHLTQVLAMRPCREMTTLIRKSEAIFPCPARKETAVFFEDVIRYVKTQENNCKYCSVLATSPGGSVLCDVKRFECVFMLLCKNVVVQTFPLCSPEWSHCQSYLQRRQGTSDLQLCEEGLNIPPYVEGWTRLA